MLVLWSFRTISILHEVYIFQINVCQGKTWRNFRRQVKIWSVTVFNTSGLAPRWFLQLNPVTSISPHFSSRLCHTDNLYTFLSLFINLFCPFAFLLLPATQCSSSSVHYINSNSSVHVQTVSALTGSTRSKTFCMLELTKLQQTKCFYLSSKQKVAPSWLNEAFSQFYSATQIHIDPQ